TPSSTPGGATVATPAPTTSAGGSTTSWPRPRWPDARAPARSTASRASPTMPPTWWTTPNAHRQAFRPAVVHPAGGVDDVLLRLRLGHALPAGRRHPGVLAQDPRPDPHRHHPDRRRRHGLHPQVHVGAAGGPLAAACPGAARAGPGLAAASVVRGDRGPAAD